MSLEMPVGHFPYRTYHPVDIIYRLSCRCSTWFNYYWDKLVRQPPAETIIEEVIDENDDNDENYDNEENYEYGVEGSFFKEEKNFSEKDMCFAIIESLLDEQEALNAARAAEQNLPRAADGGHGIPRNAYTHFLPVLAFFVVAFHVLVGYHVLNNMSFPAKDSLEEKLTKVLLLMLGFPGMYRVVANIFRRYQQYV